MCYNISNSTKEEKQLEKALSATYPKKLGQLKIRFSASGFSHPDWPVLTTDQPNEFQLFNWGLIPKWTPNSDLAKQFARNNLNSKSETIFELKSFKDPIKTKRCIIPVTGFFEWRDINKNKYPYLIQLRDQEIFSLAGIYDEWVNKDSGEVINTFSITTTEANPLMAKIHNLKLRMPCILPSGTEKEWLRGDLKEEEIKELMKPIRDSLMTAHTISKRITSRKDNPNSPETLEPFKYPELDLLDN
ncbi:MAG: SOS response-associated peptidase [Sphingobacteriaceae bacterium]|nr:SOS response-associated peptidase [Sphingobacteriaceae bacterium]